jgi:flagellar basal body-associated protein FliL
VDQQQQSRPRPTRTQVTWIGIGVVAGLFAAIVVFGGYYFEWKWTGYPKRTPWDWMHLLIVPVVLAIGGYWFTSSQNQATQAAAERRTQDEALQAYLDVMSQLLTDEKRPLRRAQIGDSLSSVARARTVTVLPRLDGERKARVVQFLYESGLIAKGRPIIDLLRADLRGADLQDAGLRGADLQGANLNGADLFRADLKWADLSFADLRGADLRSVDLLGADISNTKLRGADLRRASLRWVQEGWTVNQLRAAKSLEDATMPDGKILRGKANPCGPTFDEWVKEREDRKRDVKNT